MGNTNQASLHQSMTRQARAMGNMDKHGLFNKRLTANSKIIEELFNTLYPNELHKKFLDKLNPLFSELFDERKDSLQQQDIQRLEQGDWYLSQNMVGMQLYVDHFSNDLKGLIDKIDYFKKLGINFLHLMPITTRPKGKNDGGYAVNSYTDVDKKFGSQEDLLRLTQELRRANIYLMLDFVVNHTSDEFPWAKKAVQGVKKYQNYYYTYPTREIPDIFEKSLHEVFPETAPGNFTYNKKMKRWVMTVFNTYQWDLNYSNPEVFLEMFSNLVRLSNMGVDVIRLDALAFLWKKQGTLSQNLPEAHILISLFKMCLQVVAPGVILLAEAIVAPTEIVKYFGQGNREGNECEIAYNATLMALLWNSIATKKTNLLYKSLTNIPQKPPSTTWINYIRCHDDIGLGFDDKYIYELGWDAKLHRKFLLDYYCQNLEWSPATGLLFMDNPKTGDGRITGSSASLLGLEKAFRNQDEELVNNAINKIKMLHGIILSYGGIPMIYAGDEIGMLNDYSYLGEEDKREDSRWVNRPMQDWKTINTLDKQDAVQSHIFNHLQHLISLRKKHLVLADDNNLVLHIPNNQHILVYERTADSESNILIICNLDETEQIMDANWIASLGYMENGKLNDLISGSEIVLNSGLISIPPLHIMWLRQ